MSRLTIGILVSLLLFLGIANSDESYVPTENEEYFGTWINKEYDNEPAWAKWVIKPDGTWKAYGKEDSEEYPSAEGPYTIAEKWTDDSGDVWYKISWTNLLMGYRGYGLIHISNSGSTMEAAYGRSDYPKVIDRTKSWWNYGGIHYKK